MHQLKVNNLIKILSEGEGPDQKGYQIEEHCEVPIKSNFLQGKEKDLLEEVFRELGGLGAPVILDKLTFDFKINGFLFLLDDEVHFNRYRLSTLKTNIYSTFSFEWIEVYKRLCRTYERESLKAGLSERIWKGPPVAEKVFGKCEVPGDLSGNGSAGWKLNAYNDAQYDLISRLQGYKLIRISVFENILVGGSLKKINDLLLNPKPQQYPAIFNWLLRKMN